VCRTKEYNEAVQSTLNELVKQQQTTLHIDECKIREKNDRPNYQPQKAGTTESNGRGKKISAHQQLWLKTNNNV